MVTMMQQGDGSHAVSLLVSAACCVLAKGGRMEGRRDTREEWCGVPASTDED